MLGDPDISTMFDLFNIPSMIGIISKLKLNLNN